MNTDQSSSIERLRARLAVLLAATLTLAACASDAPPVGTIGHIQGFAGLVAADEPRAALVARDVLSAGGTAADAATALYYTLSVTLPSTASLGGGGSCIVHDPERRRTEVLEFPAMPTATAGTLPAAVPANPRAFYALHAKYGRLRLESLLAEPERLARAGTTVSRALAFDLARAAPALARDRTARALFLRPDGTPLREGDVLVQPELAAVIAGLRRNTGDFYLGVAARELTRSVATIGGTLTVEDLRDLRPAWRAPLTVRQGDIVAHFAPPPSVGSTLAAGLIGIAWPRWDDLDSGERPHLLAEAQARLFAARARWMQPTGWTDQDIGALITPARLNQMMADYIPGRHVAPTDRPAGSPTDQPASTGFAVLDGEGRAVACGIGLGGLFGLGVVAPGTGIVLAAAPGPSGPPQATTMMTVNPNTSRVGFVAAASGGATAPAALATTFLAAMVESRPLGEAVAAPRLVHPGTPDAVFIENGPFAQPPAPLTQRGHPIQAVTMPSRVEALLCRQGALSLADCAAATDPRGFGLATSVGKPE